MEETIYQKLIASLHQLELVLAANAGELSPADLRIRCLISITHKEAVRAMAESSARAYMHPGNRLAETLRDQT